MTDGIQKIYYKIVVLETKVSGLRQGYSHAHTAFISLL
jgi:hypothetical protein